MSIERSKPKLSCDANAILADPAPKRKSRSSVAASRSRRVSFPHQMRGYDDFSPEALPPALTSTIGWTRPSRCEH